MTIKKLFVLFSILLMIIPYEVAAKGFRSSRGGGFRRAAPAKSSGSRWFSGNKSSRQNVHSKHARSSGMKGKRFKSRSQAMKNYRSSSKFKSLPKEARFAKKPATRPEYIPHTMNNRPVTYNPTYGGYGYTPRPGGTFIFISSNNYVVTDNMMRRSDYYYGDHYSRSHYRSRSSSGGGFFLFFLFVIIIIIVVVIIYRAKCKREEEDSYLDDDESVAISSKPKIESDHPFFDQVFKLRKGQIVNLSDPVTIEAYDQALDFTVSETSLYQHSTFQLFAAYLENDVDDDEMIEVSLFVKEVDGDYCIYMGILDHEGNRNSLEEQGWSHLDHSGDEFSNEFHSSFIDEDGNETQATFSQYDFGAFYDVTVDGEDEPMGVCEYYPDNVDDNFEWKHAIVHS